MKAPAPDLPRLSAAKPLAFALLAAAVAAALLFATGDVRAFAGVAANLDPGGVALALAATAGAYGAWTAVFTGVANAGGARLRYRDAIPTACVSLAINNQLSTGGLGGLAVRVFGLGRLGIGAGRAAAISILSGLACDVALVSALASAAIALAAHPDGQRAAVVAAGAAAAVSVILLIAGVALVRPHWRERILGPVVAWSDAASRRLGRRSPDDLRDDFLRTVERFTHARGRLAGPLLAAVLEMSFRVACVGAAFVAVGKPQPLFVLVAGYGVGMVVGGLSMVPGGIGTIEASMAGVFALLGVDLPTAAVAVLVYRLADYVAPLLPAALALPRLLRPLEADAAAGPIQHRLSRSRAK